MKRLEFHAAVFMTAISLLLWGCQTTEMISYSNTDKALYKIDQTNCLQTPIASLSSYGLVGVVGLTFSSKDLFCLSDGTDNYELYCFNISNPASPILISRSTCVDQYPALAFCKGDGKLYGIGGEAETQLFEVDPNTCQQTAKPNQLGVNLGNKGLTCHPTTGVLYTFGSNTDSLYTIDKSTGIAGPPLGPLGIDIVGGVGLEFDPLTGKLYGSFDQNDDDNYGLYELNPSTGAGTKICSLAHGNRPNLGARVVPVAP